MCGSLKKDNYEYIDLNTENEIKVIPYKKNYLKFAFTCILIIISFGILALIFHWKRKWYILFTCNRSSKQLCDVLIIIDKYNQCHISHIKHLDACNEEQEIIFKKDEKFFQVPYYAGQFILLKTIKYFDYQGDKYVWNPETKNFFCINNFYHQLPCSYFNFCKPLCKSEQDRRRLFFGLNDISVKVKPVYKILFYEVLTPFYIFQIFSVILWFNDEYELYASCILLISLISLTQSTYEIRKDQKALHNLSKMKDTITVFRPGGNGEEHDKDVSEEISSHLLVPGDIIKIPSKGCVMSCDAILLNGSCIVNESMLTGESIPVTKTPMMVHETSLNHPSSGTTTAGTSPVFDEKKQSKHVLYCGTRVIQARYYGAECARALVYSTGYNTSKGEIIRSILHPKPCEFNFNQDSYKFIAALFALSFIGFVYSSTIKILNNVSIRLVILRSIDLVTIVVPPALPAAMTIGIVFAKNRLKRFNIFCVSPNHINVGGVLNLFCFDKTGTLTEDGLDILGVIPTTMARSYKEEDVLPTSDKKDEGDGGRSFGPEFGEMVSNGFEIKAGPFLHGMCTCHSLTTIEGNLVGDPLDIKMFERTGWLVKEPTCAEDTDKYDMLVPTIVSPGTPGTTTMSPTPSNSNDTTDDNNRISGPTDPRESIKISTTAEEVEERLDENQLNEIGIIRQFPFLSSFQRMSVVVFRLSSSTYEIYCKGSPEKIATLCDPSTIPHDFHAKLSSFTQQGFRVIALAWKPITNLKWAKIQRINREQIEIDLRFLGFLIFENKLKPASKATITKLQKANIRTVMVTGDNMLTAVSVARESCMIEPGDTVRVVKLKPPLVTFSCADDKAESRFNDFGGIYLDDLNPLAVSSTLDKSYPRYGASNDNDISFLNKSLQRPPGLDDYTVIVKSNGKRFPTPAHFVKQKINNNFFRANGTNKIGRCHLVMTGDVFQHLLDQDLPLLERILSPSSHQTPLTRDSGGGFNLTPDGCDEINNNVGVKCQSTVFARMTPDQKTCLIERFQSLDYYVGMCGDGANDCGALKTAHSGLALSDNEASLVSPFAYTGRDIGGVLPLISEGRCALTTSFGVFKYMAFYSLVQFVSVLILYWIGASFSDQQFAYVDLCIITLHALAFGRTRAYSTSSADKNTVVKIVDTTTKETISLPTKNTREIDTVGDVVSDSFLSKNGSTGRGGNHSTDCFRDILQCLRRKLFPRFTAKDLEGSTPSHPDHKRKHKRTEKGGGGCCSGDLTSGSTTVTYKRFLATRDQPLSMTEPSRRKPLLLQPSCTAAAGDDEILIKLNEPQPHRCSGRFKTYLLGCCCFSFFRPNNEKTKTSNSQSPDLLFESPPPPPPPTEDISTERPPTTAKYVTGAAFVISRVRPESSLVSFLPLFSLVSQVFIQILFLVAAYYWTKSQAWFVAYDPAVDPHEEFFAHMVSVVFYVSAFQYVIMAHVASKGPPYRQPIYTNFWFMLASFVSITFTAILLVLFPPPKLAKFFYLELLPVTNTVASSGRHLLKGFGGNQTVATFSKNSSTATIVSSNLKPYPSSSASSVIFDLWGPRMFILYLAFVDYCISVFFESCVTDRIVGPLTKGRDLLLRKKIPRFKALAKLDSPYGGTTTENIEKGSDLDPRQLHEKISSHNSMRFRRNSSSSNAFGTDNNNKPQSGPITLADDFKMTLIRKGGGQQTPSGVHVPLLNMPNLPPPPHPPASSNTVVVTNGFREQRILHPAFRDTATGGNFEYLNPMADTTCSPDDDIDDDELPPNSCVINKNDDPDDANQILLLRPEKTNRIPSLGEIYIPKDITKL